MVRFIHLFFKMACLLCCYSFTLYSSEAIQSGNLNDEVIKHQVLPEQILITEQEIYFLPSNNGSPIPISGVFSDASGLFILLSPLQTLEPAKCNHAVSCWKCKGCSDPFCWNRCYCKRK